MAAETADFAGNPRENQDIPWFLMGDICKWLIVKAG